MTAGAVPFLNEQPELLLERRCLVDCPISVCTIQCFLGWVVGIFQRQDSVLHHKAVGNHRLLAVHDA